jgi:hypothetical protein
MHCVFNSTNGGSRLGVKEFWCRSGGCLIEMGIVGYVQVKVRPGNGREGALGYERYIAIEHMVKVRPGNGREGSLGCVRRDCLLARG